MRYEPALTLRAGRVARAYHQNIAYHELPFSTFALVLCSYVAYGRHNFCGLCRRRLPRMGWQSTAVLRARYQLAPVWSPSNCGVQEAREQWIALAAALAEVALIARQ